MAAISSVTTIDQGSFIGRYSNKFKKRAVGSDTSVPLNERQIDSLVKAAKQFGKHGLRNATLILMAHRHGMRVSELINLKWNHIDLEAGNVLVSRLKNGQKTIHALSQQEVANLTQMENTYPESEYVFITERNQPLSHTVIHKMVKRAGQKAGLPISVASSMLQTANSFNFVSTRPH